MGISQIPCVFSSHAAVLSHLLVRKVSHLFQAALHNSGRDRTLDQVISNLWFNAGATQTCEISLQAFV